MIHIDFETRSECNIWHTGAYTYSLHPSTDILCLAFCNGKEKAQLITGLFDLPNAELISHIINPKSIFCAFNSFFEFCIWQNIMVQRYGWPEIPLSQWRDTMAKTCSHNLPRSLANAGIAMHAPIQKSEEGRRVMLKVCKPRKPTKSNPNKWHENKDDYETLYGYCVGDVEAEKCIDQMLMEIPPMEQKIWELDQKINWRGIAVDEYAIESAIMLSEQYKEKLTNEIMILTNGHIDAVSRRTTVMNWIKAKGIDIPGYTKQDVITLLKQDLPNDIRRVLEVRQQLGRTSIAKYQAMKTSVSGGRIRDTLLYHGASTGRWAGKLVQMHNIPRGSIDNMDLCTDVLKSRDLEYFEMLYPDVMEAISSCIRGMIISAPGHDLIVADYSAIEARALVWLAGDLKAVKIFADGKDIYIDMAQHIYNTREVSKTQRELGKRVILACGYCMGPSKFVATCATYQIKIEEKFAKTVVNMYRKQYPLIKKMWYDQERAAIRAVLTGQKITCGRVKWKVYKNFLYCQLPSGRFLAYNEPLIQKVETPWGEMKDALTFMGVNAVTKQWERTNTYGGKLTENITQAVARDFLAEGMLHIEDAGYPIVLSVHDEIISEVPEGFGSVDNFVLEMARVPAWGGNCPITAEGWRGKRYKK